MKKLVAFLAIGLLICGVAFAYNWDGSDRTELLNYVFNTTSGHDHDGVNSKKLVGVSALAAITATDAEVNMAADNSANVEVVAATNVINAAESGKTFFLNHATEFVSTLPAPAAGLRYTFVVADAPETASYTVVTTSSANLIQGCVGSSEDAAGSVSCAAAADTITFVDAKAVIGDYVKVISDGTSWFVVGGNCSVQDGIATSQAS
jgi:hypothetical protein